MKLKWYVNMTLNAIINAGFAFFSALAGMQIGGVGFHWDIALYVSGIMSGLSFFATCKHYFEDDDDDKKKGKGDVYNTTKGSFLKKAKEFQQEVKKKKGICLLCII
jgi:hypothetical protein